MTDYIKCPRCGKLTDKNEIEAIGMCLKCDKIIGTHIYD